ncbi:hypothetical protein DT076_11245 [Desertihabitans brevis]|uniref:Uncharacterized protein n=1 Tax=Desertihabitans brevis TaxID=2268447 RepID=A0A367YUF2_9ACTN|nr:hypothetical protein [Desertihabitans brevis]RCK69448.1 hypothetical protein DT076_11245 [Desertihabitans brevis]
MGIFDKIKDAVTGEGEGTGPDTTTEQQAASTSTDNGRWGDDNVDGPTGGESTIGPGDATWGEAEPAPSEAEPGAGVPGSGMPAGDVGEAVPQDDTAAPAPDDRV